MSGEDRSDPPESEVEALSRAAAEIATRRRFLRNATLAAAWAAPIIETLAVVPEAEAQGHGMGMGMGGASGGGHGMMGH